MPTVYKCPVCEFTTEKNLQSLSTHFRKRHSRPARDLYIILFHNGVEPTCKCGCGTPTKYYDLKRGFSEFAWGHGAKVHNNWGHNKEAKSKSDESRRRSFREGKWHAWNKGETKDTDPRVAAYGQKQRTQESLESRRRKSHMMSVQWETGNLQPQRGAEHPAWKGGTSALQPLCRSRLFARWTYPKLKASGFQCARCGSSGDLEVHHSGERFAEILSRFVDPDHGDEWTFEEKDRIAESVERYHLDHDVPGVVLCEDCHVAEH